MYPYKPVISRDGISGFLTKTTSFGQKASCPFSLLYLELPPYFGSAEIESEPQLWNFVLTLLNGKKEQVQLILDIFKPMCQK